MWIERINVVGLRSFGQVTQSADFSPKLTIVYADNSQGKTSLAESIEFLLTGTISRKTFTGSAAREFAESLRNAHLPTTVEPYAQMILSDPGQPTRTITRRLLSDFAASRECTSALDIDGQAAQDVTAVLPLSEPPPQTPILLQHSLRYVLSAKPQDRTAYFKAILDATDLDRLHEVLVAQARSIADPSTPLLARAEITLDLGRLVQSGDLTAATIRAAIRAKLREHLSLDADIIESSVDAEATRLLAAHEEEQFPFADVQMSASTQPSLPRNSLDRLGTAFAVNATAAVADFALMQVFDGFLRLPGLDTQSGIDCPLCLTEGAVTPARIADIRAALTSSEELRAVRLIIDTERAALLGWLEAVERFQASITPRILRSDGAQSSARVNRALLALLFEDEWAIQRQAWRDALDALSVGLQRLSDDRTSCRAALEDSAATSTDASTVACERLDRTVEVMFAAAESYRAALTPLDAEIRRRLTANSALRIPRELLALIPSAEELAHDYNRRAAATAARTMLHSAASDIAEATKTVLDAKFAALTGEISYWWNRMRPSEPATFAGLQRAGTGRRFLDLKAGLLGSPTSNPEQRDAVAVFSDSQLNCLGLAAFLARVCREDSPYVILDDPIQASDEEHRFTFVHQVPDELMRRGKQVIILTHDQRLARDMHDRYEHLLPAYLHIRLDDPAQGSTIGQTRDALQVQLERSLPLANRADPDARKRAAQIQRTAAERLCKKILVADRRRNGDALALLSDYDGFVLGTLIPLVSPLLAADPSHAGKLRAAANNLNPGSHDDGVPSTSALRQSHGDLKQLAQTYL